MLTAITSVSTAVLAVIVAVLMVIAPATPRSLVAVASTAVEASTSGADSSSLGDSVDDSTGQRATTVSRSLGVGRGATSETASAVAPTATRAPAAPAASPPPPPPTPSVDDARSFALAQTGPAQFSCLDALWQHESDWDPSAENPSSGAYGIAQALPGAKMASVGDDWMSNPITQVSWGLEYIAARYGSPCNAWSFWLNHYPHWY